ncbi:MAG TPA: FAD-dependent monooxygenase [Actinomycetes bacterium]|jgi:2-polyprenyl-6-methoxyphenol hydroxylase-like FAD-dependent oxidoreductase|nr:FAD-dependent monooxygenase [Actinomycetes bacterium]
MIDDPGGERLDVLVVGAGPTGLTLAAQLQAFGATSRIVDRQPDRVHESRALAVQPRTLEVLRGLGVAQELVARGNDAVWVQLHAGDRAVRVRLFGLGLTDTAYPFLLFVSQAETEAVLHDHLAAGGVRVERGVELVAFDAGAEAVTCTLRHGDGRTEQVRTRYLAGCDGAHSTVRRGAGIPFAGGAYPQTFALADLEVDGGLDRDTAYAYLGQTGILFFFPLGRPASWRMLGMHPTLRGGEREPAQPSLEELQALADAFTGGRLRLRDPAWLTYFRLAHRHASRYRAGRIFLAGDAAHVHSPAGAQGMNTGIQDAWNLGWKLALAARGVADEDLLDSYDAERRPVGRFVVRFTDRAFSVATSTNPLVRALRTQVVPRVLPLALRVDRALGYGFRTVAQLGISYRHSPAVQEGRPALRRGPKAGDRLPDARIARDGQVCWLGAALAAPSFHLLLCGPPGSWNTSRLTAVRERHANLLAVHHLTREAAPGALHDLDGQAFRRLGVSDTAHYLIRPDHHIGYRCGGTDLDGLGHYLARWLPNPTPPHA